MKIEVEQIAEDPWEFEVKLAHDGTVLGEYEVTVTDEEFERYGIDAEPHELVEATFKFLLEHEEPEAIQEHFRLKEVEENFPDYPHLVVDYL